MAAPFEFSAEKLVYGGDALGHHQGRAVLAPWILPGERVEVEPLRTAKGVIHARPRRILTPSRERVTAPCPYFARCGGCQYQHFSAERQTTVKTEILRETLRRLGRITWEAEIPTHAGEPWHYRNQARFQVSRRAEGVAEIGFFEAESHRLFPVDACLILSPRLSQVLAELNRGEWLRALPPCQEIEARTDDRDERVQLLLRGRFRREEGERWAKEALAGLPGVVSVALEGDGKTTVVGEESLLYRVGEFQYQVSATSFFQSSRFLLPELVSTVTQSAAGSVALDLFCGVGLFTLPLARRFSRVIGVEGHSRSAADFAANARRHELGNVQVVADTAYDFLRRWAQAEPDLVVLDPPRAGAGVALLKLLAGLRPKALDYVSCSPPTLARDLGYILQHGYRLISVELFDLFPQTYHIEALVRLARSDLASQ